MRSAGHASSPTSMVDIHCHLLPGLDDGAKDLEEALAMARMAVEDGISTIIATPHQLGSYRENQGDTIREAVRHFQGHLDSQGIPLTVRPGADIRIEEQLVSGLVTGSLVTLADQGQHVLLELPHELYMPLEPVLHQLRQHQFVGILSHPERNRGILNTPDVIAPLVNTGCLMQITAGSLLGSMGRPCQLLSEQLLREGLVHFVATDAHGSVRRRPRLAQAYHRITQLVDRETAQELCVHNPGRVLTGQPVPQGRRRPRARSWFRRRAG